MSRFRGIDAERLDLWLAFAAGPHSWREPAVPWPSAAATARAVEVGSLLVAASWPLVWLAAGGIDGDTRARILLLGLLVATAVLLASLSDRVRWDALPVHRAAGVRVIAATGAAVCWVGLAPDAALLGIWPVGVAAGADISLSSRFLGLDPDPALWVRQLAFSPAHLGVIATLGVFALTQPTGIGRLAWLYAALLVAVAAGTATLVWLRRLTARAAEEEVRIDRAAQQTELRRFGEWLHDSVAPAIRSMMTRIEGGTSTDDELLDELRALDHLLRVRRLEQAISAGPVRVAEVVEPFLRRAAQAGVQLDAMPSADVLAGDLDPPAAELTTRALAVLLNNAIEAGATRLSIDLRWHPDTLTVAVTDDAGGFDLDDAPPGRGLDRLRDALGAHRLRSRRVGPGTEVAATIAVAAAPLEEVTR